MLKPTVKPVLAKQLTRLPSLMTNVTLQFFVFTSLFLFRHSAMSSITHKERLATLLELLTRLQLPHALVVRLHVRKSNVVILTPETMFEQQPFLIGRVFHPGRSHGCCPFRVTTMRTLFTFSLKRELTREHGV